jgi:hypothetical protein
MGLKPKSNGNSNGGNFENRNFPTPKSGARRARVSLIVDLGTQEREPVWEKDGKLVKEGTEGAVSKDQKPAHQIAVFADLVNDVVDYGGDIGEAQYRLMLNKGFKGDIQGVNFNKVPPMDAKGNRIEGKSWSFHPQNLLTKLGKAVEIDGFGDDNNDDLELLLGKQFVADVEVKEVNSGKQDKEGNDIIYKNVNFKGASKVPAEIKTDDEGNETEVVPTFAKLRQAPRLITFDDATEEDVKFLRKDVIKKIKLSLDYAGSTIQKAIEAFEAKNGGPKDDADSADKPAAKPAAKKPQKPKAPVAQDDMDDDIPF